MEKKKTEISQLSDHHHSVFLRKEEQLGKVA